MKLFEIQFISLFCFGAILAGCSVDTATNSLGGDSGEQENIPTTDKFQALVNTNSNYHVSISQNGDGTTPCEAVEGEDNLCIVDMYEMDMYMHGYTMNIAFNPEMCKYWGFHPYYYNTVPVGKTPSMVYYNLDADGNMVAPGATFATINGQAADIYYYFPGFTGGISSTGWIAHSSLYNSTAEAAEDVRCPWDYTSINSKYKSCCEGLYKTYSVEDGELSVSDATEWGGKIGNCFHGPGIVDYPAQGYGLDDHGMPVYTLNEVDTDEGAITSFSVSAPFSLFSILGRGQYYAANFYDKADFGGASPDPTLVEQSGVINTSMYESTANFQFDCFDEASEVKARIRVMGREWNTYTEFAAFLAGDTSADPDVGGTETSPNRESGDLGTGPAASKYDDFGDWLDIQNDSSDVQFPVGITDKAGAFSGGFDFQLKATLPTALIYGEHSQYTGFIMDGR